MYFLGEKDWVMIGICTGALALGIALLLIFTGNIESTKTQENIEETITDSIEENNSIEEENNSEEIINLIGGNTEDENLSKVENDSLNETEIIPNETIFTSISLYLESQEETILLAKENRELNLNEKLIDVFREYVEEEHLPIFLKNNIDTLDEHTQEIRLSENFEIKEFSDNKYNDGEKTDGFHLSNNDLILDYEIDFGGKLSWNELVDKDVFILGRHYKVIFADYNSKKISLLEFPYSFILKEGEILEFETSKGKNNLSIYFLAEEYVALNIDGEKTKKLYKKDSYGNENMEIAIENIIPSNKYRKGKVDIIISPRKLVFQEGTFQHDSKNIEEIEISFVSVSKDVLEKIKISWELEEEFFLTSKTTLTMPFFETINFTMSERIIDEQENNYWEVFLNTKSYTANWNKTFF